LAEIFCDRLPEHFRREPGLAQPPLQGALVAAQLRRQLGNRKMVSLLQCQAELMDDGGLQSQQLADRRQPGDVGHGLPAGIALHLPQQVGQQELGTLLAQRRVVLQGDLLPLFQQLARTGLAMRPAAHAQVDGLVVGVKTMDQPGWLIHVPGDLCHGIEVDEHPLVDEALQRALAHAIAPALDARLVVALVRQVAVEAVAHGSRKALHRGPAPLRLHGMGDDVIGQRSRHGSCIDVQS